MVSAGASTLIADAEDTELGRPVTVKLVRPEIAESPEFRRKFEATMRAMAKLSHPNIAAVHDWGEEEVGRRTTVYAVVEHLGGGSLRDLFDRNRRLEPSQALMVGLEACRGLDFAHRKHLVHGELTPSKLVFGDDRRLRIVDFGLARLLGADDWKEPSTVPTHVARYSSPEQALGQPIDGRSDVYSLALILVEAVTGAVPFAARSTVATLSARVGRLMPVSADLGPLAAVLERAGRPDPADRSTAAELGRSLVRAAEKLPRPAPIPLLLTPTYQDDPNRLRRPNDPTGGVDRPPPEPAVALVPPTVAPAAPGPDEPAEPTVPATAEERAAGASLADAAVVAAGAAATGVAAAAGAGPQLSPPRRRADADADGGADATTTIAPVAAGASAITGTGGRRRRSRRRTDRRPPAPVTAGPAARARRGAAVAAPRSRRRRRRARRTGRARPAADAPAGPPIVAPPPATDVVAGPSAPVGAPPPPRRRRRSCPRRLRPSPVGAPPESLDTGRQAPPLGAVGRRPRRGRRARRARLPRPAAVRGAQAPGARSSSARTRPPPAR